jgi:integrase
MFSWCTGEGLVKPDVVAVLREIPALRKGKTPIPESAKSRQKSKLVSQSIVEATLPNLPDVVADMVRLQQLLGCRPGELCGIKPSMVVSTTEIWTIGLAEHKTEHHDHERTIYVGPRAQAILVRYLDRPADAYCFSPKEAMAQHRAKKSAKRTTPPNQGNRSGYNDSTRGGAAKARYNDHYSASSYGHSISRACKATWPAPEGLDAEQTCQWHSQHRWTPHQLRHAAGQEIRTQFGLEHVAAVLGHADIETSKIYSAVRADQAIEAAKTR